MAGIVSESEMKMGCVTCVLLTLALFQQLEATHLAKSLHVDRFVHLWDLVRGEVEERLNENNNSEVGFTLFAPTNEWLPTLTNSTAIKEFVQHHVVSGSIRGDSTQERRNLAGKSVRVTRSTRGLFVNGARLTGAKMRVPSTNGVVHVIKGLLCCDESEALNVAIEQTLDDLLSIVHASTFRSLTYQADCQVSLEPPGIYTVFVPTDAAFANVSSDVLNALKADNATLRSTLLYHVVPGRFPLSEIQHGQPLITKMGNVLFPSIQSTLDNKTQTVVVGGGRVLRGNIFSKNGIVHVIDRVILDIPHGNSLQTLSERPEFSLFLQEMEDAQLTPILTGRKPYTIFAPTNEVMKQLKEMLGKRLPTELLSLVVFGPYFTANFQPGLKLETIGGINLPVEENEGVTTIGGVPFSLPEILTTNGVIHPLATASGSSFFPSITTDPPTQGSTPQGRPQLPDANVLLFGKTDDHSILDVIQVTLQKSVPLRILITTLLVTSIGQDLKKNGPFTLFAPIDSAFKELTPPLFVMLVKNNTFVRELLYNHLVPGRYTCEDLKKNVSLTTIRGQILQIRPRGDCATINGAGMLYPDIIASNGIVHVVDSVVWSGFEPSDIQTEDTDLTDRLRQLNSTIMADLLIKNGLLNTIYEKGPFTLLSPIDTAWSNVPIHTGVALKELLLYHLIPSKILTPGLNMTINSSLGAPISIKILQTVVLFASSPVLIANQSFSQGVIHILQKVLYPIPHSDIITTLSSDPQYRAYLILKFLQPLLPKSATLFFPVDVDFELLLQQPVDIQDLLASHVINQTLFTSEFKNGMYLTTVNNKTLTINNVNGNWTINNRMIIQGDILCTDGVIHLISGFVFDVPFQTTVVTQYEDDKSPTTQDLKETQITTQSSLEAEKQTSKLPNDTSEIPEATPFEDKTSTQVAQSETPETVPSLLVTDVTSEIGYTLTEESVLLRNETTTATIVRETVIHDTSVTTDASKPDSVSVYTEEDGSAIQTEGTAIVFTAVTEDRFTTEYAVPSDITHEGQYVTTFASEDISEVTKMSTDDDSGQYTKLPSTDTSVSYRTEQTVDGKPTEEQTIPTDIPHYISEDTKMTEISTDGETRRYTDIPSNKTTASYGTERSIDDQTEDQTIATYTPIDISEVTKLTITTGISTDGETRGYTQIPSNETTASDETVQTIADDQSKDHTITTYIPTDISDDTKTTTGISSDGETRGYITSNETTSYGTELITDDQTVATYTTTDISEVTQLTITTGISTDGETQGYTQIPSNETTASDETVQTIDDDQSKDHTITTYIPTDISDDTKKTTGISPDGKTRGYTDIPSPETTTSYGIERITDDQTVATYTTTDTSEYTKMTKTTKISPDGYTQIPSNETTAYGTVQIIDDTQTPIESDSRVSDIVTDTSKDFVNVSTDVPISSNQTDTEMVQGVTTSYSSPVDIITTVFDMVTSAITKYTGYLNDTSTDRTVNLTAEYETTSPTGETQDTLEPKTDYFTTQVTVKDATEPEQENVTKSETFQVTSKIGTTTDETESSSIPGLHKTTYEGEITYSADGKTSVATKSTTQYETKETEMTLEVETQTDIGNYTLEEVTSTTEYTADETAQTQSLLTGETGTTFHSTDGTSKWNLTTQTASSVETGVTQNYTQQTDSDFGSTTEHPQYSTTSEKEPGSTSLLPSATDTVGDSDTMVVTVQSDTNLTITDTNDTLYGITTQVSPAVEKVTKVYPTQKMETEEPIGTVTQTESSTSVEKTDESLTSVDYRDHTEHSVIPTKETVTSSAIDLNETDSMVITVQSETDGTATDGLVTLTTDLRDLVSLTADVTTVTGPIEIANETLYEKTSITPDIKWETEPSTNLSTITAMEDEEFNRTGTDSDKVDYSKTPTEYSEITAETGTTSPTYSSEDVILQRTTVDKLYSEVPSTVSTEEETVTSVTSLQTEEEKIPSRYTTAKISTPFAEVNETETFPFRYSTEMEGTYSPLSTETPDGVTTGVDSGIATHIVPPQTESTVSPGVEIGNYTAPIESSDLTKLQSITPTWMSSESVKITEDYFKPTETFQQNYTGSTQQDYTGSIQQDYTGSTQQVYTGSTQQNYTGSTQDDYTGSTQDDYTGSTQQDYTGSTQQDYTGSTQQVYTGSIQQDHTGSTQQDHTGSTQQDHTGSTQQDHTGSTHQDHTGSTQQDYTGSTQQKQTDVSETDETPAGSYQVNDTVSYQSTPTTLSPNASETQSTDSPGVEIGNYTAPIESTDLTKQQSITPTWLSSEGVQITEDYFKPNETVQQDYTRSTQQDYTRSTQEDYTGSTQQDYTGSTQQDYTGSTQQDYTGSTEQKQTGVSKTDETPAGSYQINDTVSYQSTPTTLPPNASVPQEPDTYTTQETASDWTPIGTSTLESDKPTDFEVDESTIDVQNASSVTQTETTPTGNDTLIDHSQVPEEVNVTSAEGGFSYGIEKQTESTTTDSTSGITTLDYQKPVTASTSISGLVDVTFSTAEGYSSPTETASEEPKNVTTKVYTEKPQFTSGGKDTTTSESDFSQPFDRQTSGTPEETFPQEEPSTPSFEVITLTDDAGNSYTVTSLLTFSTESTKYNHTSNFTSTSSTRQYAYSEDVDISTLDSKLQTAVEVTEESTRTTKDLQTQFTQGQETDGQTITAIHVPETTPQQYFTQTAQVDISVSEGKSDRTDSTLTYITQEINETELSTGMEESTTGAISTESSQWTRVTDGKYTETTPYDLFTAPSDTQNLTTPHLQETPAVSTGEDETEQPSTLTDREVLDNFTTDGQTFVTEDTKQTGIVTDKYYTHAPTGTITEKFENETAEESTLLTILERTTGTQTGTFTTPSAEDEFNATDTVTVVVTGTWDYSKTSIDGELTPEVPSTVSGKEETITSASTKPKYNESTYITEEVTQTTIDGELISGVPSTESAEGGTTTTIRSLETEEDGFTERPTTQKPLLPLAEGNETDAPTFQYSTETQEPSSSASTDTTYGTKRIPTEEVTLLPRETDKDLYNRTTVIPQNESVTFDFGSTDSESKVNETSFQTDESTPDREATEPAITDYSTSASPYFTAVSIDGHDTEETFGIPTETKRYGEKVTTPWFQQTEETDTENDTSKVTITISSGETKSTTSAQKTTDLEEVESRNATLFSHESETSTSQYPTDRELATDKLETERGTSTTSPITHVPALDDTTQTDLQESTSLPSTQEPISSVFIPETHKPTEETLVTRSSTMVSFPITSVTSVPSVTETLPEVLETLPATTLKEMLEKAGLDFNLTHAGPITIFAPTDSAFGSLENGTLQNLWEDADALQEVLLYHCSPIRISIKDLSSLIKTPTLSGRPLFIHTYKTKGVTKVQVNGAALQPIEHPINNGIIYLIGQVLSPPSGSLIHLIDVELRLRSLLAYLMQSDLESLLKTHGPLTLFAPSEAAWTRIPLTTVLAFGQQPEVLRETLLNHLVRGAVYTNSIVGGSRLKTLGGNILDFETDGDEVFVNRSRIVRKDVTATNGVIHIVDQLFLPEKIPARRLPIQTSPPPFISLMFPGSSTELISSTSLTQELKDLGLDKFLKLLADSGLLETLQNMKFYTLLVPSNEAFSKVNQNVIGNWKSNLRLALQIGQNHILPGFVFANNFTNASYPTLSGNRLNVQISNDHKVIKVNDAQIVIPDQQLQFAVVHVVDRILIPSTKPTILQQMTSTLPQFSWAMKSVNLQSYLQNGPYTVFAPSDLAWLRLPQELWTQLTQNQSLMTDLLLGHICASEGIPSEGFQDGKICKSLSGRDIFMENIDDSWTVNGIPLTRSDITGSDGVIHVINGLLWVNNSVYSPKTYVAPVRQPGSNFTPSRPRPIAKTTPTPMQITSLSPPVNLTTDQFYSFINQANLTATVNEGPYTVFAPTDAAINQFLRENTQATMDPEKMRSLLLRHIVIGRVGSADLLRSSELPTLSGENLKVTVNYKFVTLNDATILGKQEKTNVTTDVYIIDHVISPAHLQPIGSLMKRQDLLFTLNHLLQGTGLDQLLNNGPVTAFLPCDSAFANVNVKILDQLRRNQSALQEFLFNHIVSGNHYKRRLQDGEVLTTIGGQPLYIYADAKINDSNIIQGDILASNGVLHIIDKVLFGLEPVSQMNSSVMPSIRNMDTNVLSLASILNASLFLDLVNESGMESQIFKNNVQTLFAPTDEAFQSLPTNYIQQLKNNTSRLRRFLKYHVVPGRLTTNTMVPEQVYSTLVRGKGVRINSYKTPEGTQWTASGSVIVRPDNEAHDGVIHLIDQTMYLPWGNIAQTVKQSSVLQSLSRSIDFSGLTKMLKENSPFTLFAPSDEAFQIQKEIMGERFWNSPDAVQGIILRHLVRGTHYTSGLNNRSSLTSLSGAKIQIRTLADGYLVNNATLLYPDVTTTNGVIHVINQIL